MEQRSDFQIARLTDAECALLNANLLAFNSARVPLTQDPPFIHLNFGLRDDAGTLLAGIIATIYCWRCVCIESLWVDAHFRRKGYGSRLLRRVEDEAKDRNCTLIHLDTFEFQSKEFYLAHGYGVFGVLDDCPPGHTRIYLKKTLSTL